MVTKYKTVGAHGRNASLGSAVELTPPAGADAIRVQVETQNIRYTTDNETVPTTTVGFKLLAGDEDIIAVGGDDTFHVIAETAGAVINYQWLALAPAL